MILFGYNIDSLKQLKNLTALLQKTCSNSLIDINQEGGLIEKLNTKKGFIDTKLAKKILLNHTSNQG